MYASKSLLRKRTREQVVTIPNMKVGKESSEALAVWINVWFTLNICINEGLANGMQPHDLRSMWIPPPRHQYTKIRVRYVTMTGTSLERIPIHSLKAMKQSCIMTRKSWRAKRKNGRMRPKWCKSCAPWGNSHYPNQPNSTTLRVVSQRLASPPKEECFQVAHRGPPAKPSY